MTAITRKARVRLFRRSVVIRLIPRSFYQRRITQPGLTIAAAARGGDPNYVALGNLDILILGEMGRDIGLAAAFDAHQVHGPIRTTQHPQGTCAAVVHDKRSPAPTLP